MMSKRKINDRTAGGLLFLLVFLSLHFLKGIVGLSGPDTRLYGDKVFVEIIGDVAHPGVYGFPHPPSLNDLLIRAGGSLTKTANGLPSTPILYHSGAQVGVFSDRQEVPPFEGEMAAFYKITLGIPISINKEPLEGLTAVPGIGPALASAIIEERAKSSGFQRLDELLAIRGIGPALYQKLTPHLVL
jgi:competence protein ComEA